MLAVGMLTSRTRLLYRVLGEREEMTNLPTAFSSGPSRILLLDMRKLLDCRRKISRWLKKPDQA